MAKAKYLEWTGNPDKLLLLSGWARDGLTDEEIAKKIGITRSTLSEWKKKYTDISDTLKKGKEIVDMEVETSLYKKTQGFKVTVKKTFKCKTIEYDSSGKKKKEEEKLEVGEDEIYVQPDTVAIIFWLKNRMPDKWKDKRYEVEALGDDSEENRTGIILMESIREDMENEAEDNTAENEPD